MRNKQDNALEQEFKTRFSEFNEEYIKNLDIKIPPLNLSFMKEKPKKKRNFHRFSLIASFCMIIFVVSSGVALWINSESAHALKFKAEKFYHKNFNGFYTTDDSADFSESEMGITIENMKDMESAAAYFPQLVFPYYLPEGFELKKLDITKFSNGTASSDYQFLDKDDRKIIIGVFYNLPEESSSELLLKAEEINIENRTVYYMYDAYTDTSAVSFLSDNNLYNVSGDVDKESLIKIALEIDIYKGTKN